MSNLKQKYAQLSTSQIFELYNTEDACREFFFKLKWPSGYICRECGCAHYNFISTRSLYQCKCCMKQESVGTHTIMQDTKLKLFTWILGLYYVTTSKQGISSECLAERLGISTKASRLMIRKIRYAMEVSNGNLKLHDTIEIDGTYVGCPSKNGKRGLGTDKTPVLISLSLDNGIYPKHLQMNIMKSECRKEIKECISKNIDITNTKNIITDGKNHINLLRLTMKILS